MTHGVWRHRILAVSDKRGNAKKQPWDGLAKHLTLTPEKRNQNKYTGDQVKQKWKNMEARYKRAMTHNNSTGREPDNWLWADKMAEAMENKHNIKPPVLLSSAGPDVIQEEKRSR